MSELKVPKRFRLFGHTIDVIFQDDLSENEDAVGQARYRKNQIVLQSTNGIVKRPESQIGQTFCHELVHWITNEMGEDKDEKYVDIFGSLLHQALTTMEY